MNWLSILGIVVILIAVASTFGLNPRGGRPVAGTRLMSAARLCLVVFGILMVYLGWRSH